MELYTTIVTFDPTADPLVKPRPPSATSIPAILKLLQDEWVCCGHVSVMCCHVIRGSPCVTGCLHAAQLHSTTAAANCQTRFHTQHNSLLHVSSLSPPSLPPSTELSHALYQHDAACRVIARLTKEVTAAREGRSGPVSCELCQGWAVSRLGVKVGLCQG